MFRHKIWLLSLAACCLCVCAGTAWAQTLSFSVSNMSEDFTGTSTTYPWYFFNGACLTARSSNATSNPGTPPGCIDDDYYTENLVGGYNGAFGGAQTLPDPVGDGALRFTNGCIDLNKDYDCSSGGYGENGAIVSADTFSTNQGLNVTFKTVTYRGNSGGANGDGADGMSFFLVDASEWSPTADAIGSWGGSLGYTCSNTNADYHGMVGAYLGLGIDEYGNFLNGSAETNGETNGTQPNSPWEDNTASGGFYLPNRIGLRGAGNIAWPWLNDNYSDDYPSSLTSTQQQEAVKYTCRTGLLWNFSDPDSPQETSVPVMDYPAIPSAYEVISAKIAKEYDAGGFSRQEATPITYRLKVTQNGLLSLWYSYNGGAWTGVIENQDITKSNAPLPSSLRFGFAGSTGGSTNIHELLCFKADPITQASSSATANERQSSKVETGSQVYVGYYDPADWTGRLAAYGLSTDSSGNLTIASLANWDAACVLTGVAGGATCPTTDQSGSIAPESPTSRVMLTWGSTSGIPFEWSSLSSAEQDGLDLTVTTSGLTNDSTLGQERLNYLRGDRSDELTTSGTGDFRDRDSVLGDIVDSSSTWVGPPAKTIYSDYESPQQWQDKLYPTVTMPENSGQTYSQYAAAEATRLNVVYIGANDGLLHGFAAGSFDSTGTVYDSSSNTGEEVLAYMPEGVLQDIHSAYNANVDYSNPQYGHNFYVDATPGTGDLYYGGEWHTWLVSGVGPGNTAQPWSSKGACGSTTTPACYASWSSTVQYSAGETVSENGVNYLANTNTVGQDPALYSGPGGAEIFALDITHPSKFSESNAAGLVIGDWTNKSLTCANVSGCGQNLGDTYGTPVIRRLHDGDWGIIFGNGIGSTSGDAGIYVMTVDPSNGAITTYYVSAGVPGTNDGIAYVSPVDMDGDHVVDFVYAGDINGNVWRFDLTSNDPSKWTVSPGPIFKTPSGQPITTVVKPAFVTNQTTGQTQMMLLFGTGDKFPITNTSATTYQSGTQAFYGIWDWNMSAWNAHNLTQFDSLSASSTGLSAPYTLSQGNLQQQSITMNSSGVREIDNPASICWAGDSACSTGMFGWYIDLPGINSEYNQTTYEQLVYNPTIVSTAVIFNSILPGIDSPLACDTGQDADYLYALDVRSGAPVTGPGNTPFFGATINNGNVHTIGFLANDTGTESEVTTTNGSTGATNTYLIAQCTSGGCVHTHLVNTPNNITGSRTTWIELR